MTGQLGERGIVSLSYYQPWVYAGSERYTQLLAEELRQGRQQAFVYLAEAGERASLESHIRQPEFSGLALFRHTEQGLVAESPVAVRWTEARGLRLAELLDRLSPWYIRVHFPVREFIDVLEAPSASGHLVVYDVMDLWEEFVATPWGSDADEARLVARADALAVVTHPLAQRWSASADPIQVIPNAVDREFLGQIQRAPETLAAQGTPKRVLYMGSMGGSWFDWETLRSVVIGVPECAFVLLGSLDLPPEEHDPASARRIRALAQVIAKSPNVTFASEVSHDELAPWLRNADVGIIPFLPGALIEAVSPLKVFEYLGAGAVVVQSGMPDIEAYPGVRTAQDAEEFVRLVREHGPATMPVPELEAMAWFVRGNTWEQRVSALDAMVESVYAQRATPPPA